MESLHILCHECDHVCTVRHPHRRGKHRCPICGHILYKQTHRMVEHLFVLSLSALILYILANIFPFLAFEVSGNTTHTNLSTSVYHLFQEDQWILGISVLTTIILIPLVQVVALLALFGPLYFGVLPPYASRILKLLDRLNPWGMMEIFFIGILVSVVKLVKMGQIIPGSALWTFICLIFVMALIQLKYQPHDVWKKINY